MDHREAGVVVKYARAHEHVRGRPRMLEQYEAMVENKKGVWLDFPSELVYYYCGPFVGPRMRLKKPPLLVLWEAAPVIVVDEDVEAESVDDHHHDESQARPSNEVGCPSNGANSHYLKPATRHAEEASLWYPRTQTFFAEICPAVWEG